MCYTCGCGAPDMGEEKSIAEGAFQEAAEAAGISVKQAKINTANLLKKTIK